MLNQHFNVGLSWALEGDDFGWDKYSRNHQIRFSGGQSFVASAAPAYLGDPALVNPEQSLVAALSSCHMLTFLAIAAKKKLKVLNYQDSADCEIGKDETGIPFVNKITLRPRVSFADPQPTSENIEKLHQSAHKACFISHSVKAEVVIETQ